MSAQIKTGIEDKLVVSDSKQMLEIQDWMFLILIIGAADIIVVVVDVVVNPVFSVFPEN